MVRAHPHVLLDLREIQRDSHAIDQDDALVDQILVGDVGIQKQAKRFQRANKFERLGRAAGLGAEYSGLCLPLLCLCGSRSGWGDEAFLPDKCKDNTASLHGETGPLLCASSPGAWDRWRFCGRVTSGAVSFPGRKFKRQKENPIP